MRRLYRSCSFVWVFCLITLFNLCVYFFFFKQKTAYEMRISDWSSDVCSSDLSTPAVASDNTWACEVVLCISNPGGPTQYPACVPPITKLWRVLALGGSFPTCTGGGIAKTKYKKPDDGRPGRLTVTWTDGRQQTYYQPRN